MYVFTPLAYTALFRGDPDYKCPFILKGGRVLAPLSFIAANLLVYWSGWGVVWRLLLLIVFGFILMALSLVTKRAGNRPPLDLRYINWLWPYLIGIAVISYLGQYGGGLNIITLWIDILVVAVFSLVIFFWAVASVRPTTEARASVDGDMESEVMELPAEASQA